MLRAVPFWSRAALPLLAARGILGMSFGSGGPPGRPYGVPPLFLWRDVASGAELVVTSESGYGGPGTEFVLPSGVALAVAWSGDNSGPSDRLAQDLQGLRERFPGAHVHASTFTAFFREAVKPQNKHKLPVVTAEIGDAWIYGVPSDPRKVAEFRAASRARAACLGEGSCTLSQLRTFDRLLVKVPEHTWGLAQSWFIPDYTNWSNTQFERAKAAVTAPLPDNRFQADYYTQLQSWHEQRHFVYNAVESIRPHLPALAASIDAEFAIINSTAAPQPEATGFTKVMDKRAVMQCGDATIGFDPLSGAIAHLRGGQGQMQWANSSHVLGKWLYQSFDDSDYQTFLAGSASDNPSPGNPEPGFGRPSCTPNNTRAICGNFNKKPPQTHNTGGETHCEYLLEGTLPNEAHTLAGAPATVWTRMRLRAAPQSMELQLEYYMLGKTATRLPESIFVQFTPAVSPSSAASRGAEEAPKHSDWRLEMFNDSNIMLDREWCQPSLLSSPHSGSAFCGAHYPHCP